VLEFPFDLLEINVCVEGPPTFLEQGRIDRHVGPFVNNLKGWVYSWNGRVTSDVTRIGMYDRL
jgi:hypothetical protein